MARQDKNWKNTGNMQHPEHNLLGTEKKNRMEHAHSMNDGRLVRRVYDRIRGRETEDDQWNDGETHWCKQVFGLYEEKKKNIFSHISHLMEHQRSVKHNLGMLFLAFAP
jgi:endo-beta-N-acetylglucosaminidase D